MVLDYPQRFQDIGMLVLRVGVGLAYVFLHGWGKIFGGPEAWARTGKAMGYVGIDGAYVFWGFMAGFSEFVGGILIVSGLFFRPACILLFITMFVAVTQHLSTGDGWRGSAHALKMAVVFLSLTAIGPGKYSLDHIISRRLKLRATRNL